MMNQLEIQKQFPDSTPEELVDLTRYCENMSVFQLIQYANRYNSARKDTTKTLFLTLIGGIFGIHRFYLGQTMMGIAYLLTLGGLGILAFVDFFRVKDITLAANLQIARHTYDSILPEIMMDQVLQESKKEPVLETKTVSLTKKTFFPMPNSSEQINKKTTIPQTETKRSGASSPFELPPDW